MSNKKGRCTGCKQYFIKDKLISLGNGNYHSFQCATDHSQKKRDASRDKIKKAREIEFKKETRQRKKKLRDNDRTYQLSLTQSTFNKFIRLRDHGHPCISCQSYKFTQAQAGHYKTRGAHPELSFNEMNCHLQCSQCNSEKSGNIIEYRINLVKKIGVNNVEWLEGPHDIKRLTIEEIKELNKLYKQKCKDLQQLID